MKSLALIIFGALLFSCKKPDPAAEFNSYLASIITLQTPINVGLATPLTSFDTTLFKKFKHADAQKPVGKLMLSDSILLLIEQMNFSEQNMIRTMSTTGRAVDMKTLYAAKEDCSSDYGYNCSRMIYIGNDKEIVVTDSIRKSRINDNGEIVKDSEQLRISKRIWTVDDRGYFSAGKLINVDSVITSEMISELYSERTFSKELYPEETEGADVTIYTIYFVDLDNDTPNVIISFNYAAGGNNIDASDVAIIYFQQKNGRWNLDKVEIVPLESLDNG